MRSATARSAFVVRFAPGFITLIIAVLLCIAPTRAHAQVVGTWTCGNSQQCGTVMGAMTGRRTFSTNDDCEAWGTANFYKGSPGYSCSGGGGNGWIGSPAGAIGDGFLFSLLGAGIGSIADTSGKYIAPGALLMGGIIPLGMAMANKSTWSRTATTVVGTAGGCATGAGVGMGLDKKAEIEGTAEPGDAKKVGPYAAGGCAAGFVLGATLPSLMNHFPPLRWMRRTSRPISMVNHGQDVGVRIAW